MFFGSRVWVADTGACAGVRTSRPARDRRPGNGLAGRAGRLLLAVSGRSNAPAFEASRVVQPHRPGAACCTGRRASRATLRPASARAWHCHLSRATWCGWARARPAWARWTRPGTAASMGSSSGSQRARRSRRILCARFSLWPPPPPATPCAAAGPAAHNRFAPTARLLINVPARRWHDDDGAARKPHRKLREILPNRHFT